MKTPEEQKSEAIDRIKREASAMRARRVDFENAKRLEWEKLQAPLDSAIFDAVSAGVPKSHISTLEVLGTKNPYAVTNALERHGGGSTARLVSAPDTGRLEPFTLTENGDVSIEYRAYPSTAAANPDYPAVLRGKVRRLESGEWLVIDDPTDSGEPDSLDFLPGWLRFELERPYESEGALERRLDDWLGEQRADG